MASGLPPTGVRRGHVDTRHLQTGITEWMKAAFGCWLLIAPFALGYGGTAAWNDRVVGALTLSLVVVGNDTFALWAWLRANIPRYRSRRFTLMDIIEYQDSEKPLSPEVLSRQIVECSDQIRQTLLGDPSEAEVEMCAGVQRLYGRSDHACCTQRGTAPEVTQGLYSRLQ